MPSPSLRALARYRFNPASRISSTSTASIHTTCSLAIKDSLKDRTKIDRESTEYAKSSSDDQAAGTDTAFKPGETDPQQEMSKQSQQGDTLNVSPGNHEVSQGVKPDAGGAEKSGKDSAGESKSSGPGSPSKGKKLL